MNVFNRTITILLALAILAAAIVVILIVAGTLTSEDLPAGWLTPQIEWLATTSGGMKALVAIVSFFVLLVMLAVIISELRIRGRESRFLISSRDEGTTTVTKDSVRSLVEQAGKGIRNVDDFDCKIRDKDNGLAIACTAWVTMGANLTELSNQLQSEVKRIAQEVTGLPVNEVDVGLRYKHAKSQRLAVR